MAPGCGCNDSVMPNKAKGFYNHSANAINNEKPIYWTWEVKEVISTEEFQKIIDGPSGPGFGIDVLMNINKSIDIPLWDGQIPYTRVFHKQLSWIF